jgi:hypothetical protein
LLPSPSPDEGSPVVLPFISTNLSTCTFARKVRMNQDSARTTIETAFSLLTVICKAKKIHHHLEPYIEACMAYTSAMFNVCLISCIPKNPLSK